MPKEHTIKIKLGWSTVYIEESQVIDIVFLWLKINFALNKQGRSCNAALLWNIVCDLGLHCLPKHPF